MGVLTENARPLILMAEEKNQDELSIHGRITFKQTPKCVSAEQYKKWQAAARWIPPQNYGFCTDCTKEYQSKMLEAGRCSHPEIKFRKRGRLKNEGFIPAEENE